MFAASFEYKKAGSVSDAIQILSNDSEAKVLAGGQSLIPLLKLRLARPTVVVDIGGIQELKGINVDGGTMRVGSLTTHSEIASSHQVHESCEILAEAAGGVGDPAVRNRGTIGGNVSHADPASDLPTVLTALNANFSVQGKGGLVSSGSRSVPASEFFTGAFTTALAENEILTGVEVPVLQTNQVAEYAKMSHPATHFAVVGAAVVITLEEGTRCTAASVAVGGLVPKPMRAPSVENALVGQQLTQELITAAADRVADDLGSDIIGDIFASADYRKAMAAIELKHALFHAVGLAHH
jgi:carbon-monoxide dehydrogenase medium subunit